MVNTHQRRQFTWLIASFLAMLTGCSPNFHKQDADKEVYNIIDSKWRPKFGEKANYIVADSNLPAPNDVNVAKPFMLDKPMTLAQAVAIATKYNRDYQTQKEQLYLTALNLTGERYKYAFQWFATVDAEYTKTGEFTEDTDSTAKAEAGVSRTFLTPQGVIINSALKIDWARFLTGDPRTTLASLLTADLDIPLLGNGGGKAAWENLTQAERNVLYQVRTFNRFRQTFVVSVINDYYRVLQQKDRVTNAKNNWNSSIEARKQAEMEAKTGRSAAFEVAQAQQRELVAYNGYVLTIQSYEQTLDSFKIRLTIPTNVPLVLDQNELEALTNLAKIESTYTADAAIETALLMRLDLANAVDGIDDSLRKATLAADGLGPQLDLTASAAVNSTPPRDADRLEFHKGSYTAGASLDLPLDRKNQRNTYRAALLTLQQSQRDYDDTVDSVMFDVRQAFRQLEATAEQYIIQKKSLALAEDRVKNTTLLLKLGRVQMRDLLDAQDSLLQAQNDLTSALVGHTIAKLTFYRDVGILQVKPDGMWAQSPQGAQSDPKRIAEPALDTQVSAAPVSETVTGKTTNEREPVNQSADNL
jgi:outer membrane protein TolC